MSGQTWMQKSGATPGKLALVACLAVALVFVLWNQNTDGADETRVNKKPPQSTPPKPTAAVNEVLISKPVSLELSNKHNQQDWPKLPLKSVVKHDPFAKPAWYLAALDQQIPSGPDSVAKSKEILERLRKEQTKIVVITEDERIATIGNLNFREGDTIEGLEITAIRTDGVILTEKDQ